MPALARGNTKGCVQDKATRATYDVLGRKVTTTAPGSDRAQFYYVNSDYAVDDLRLHKQVNPDDTWTEFTYGKLGRVTHTHTSTGATTNSTYDMGGRCVSSTNSNGFVTTFAYDHLGRQTAAGASGQPTFSEFEYNTLGWRLKIQDADGFASTFVFNNAGRVTSRDHGGPHHRNHLRLGRSGPFAKRVGREPGDELHLRLLRPGHQRDRKFKLEVQHLL
jgi:YD repeat-containing protein